MRESVVVLRFFGILVGWLEILGERCIDKTEARICDGREREVPLLENAKGSFSHAIYISETC